jgi:transposase
MFAALSRVAKVCRRSWKWKSPIPDALTARSKQTSIWRRFRPVRVGSEINSSSGASGAGLSLQSKIGTTESRQRLHALALPPALATQRDEWLNLLDALDTKIATAEQWLTAAAASNAQVMRLQTHPGIGLITSLALVHTLEPVSRFPTARKVVAYAGLDPVEHSSAEKKRYGSISKEAAASCGSS